MKVLAERTSEERKEIGELLANWLEMYTYEVITKVMERVDEITNNEFTMNLLRELKTREDKEHKTFVDCFVYGLVGCGNPHNHAITHSESYRDVLYDMYIRDIKV